MVFKMINIFLKAVRELRARQNYKPSLRERAKSHYSTVELTSIKLVFKDPVRLKLNLPVRPPLYKSLFSLKFENRNIF